MQNKRQKNMLKQTFYKTLSYGVMHMVIAIMVAYALSGSWSIALAIGLIEPCVQTVAYFFHENIWRRVEHKNRMTSADAAIANSVSPFVRIIEKIFGHKH
jgi:uncharacterized membrane protein